MVRLATITSAFATLAVTANASLISEYYYQSCGGTVNQYFTGSTPTYCNTQVGASIGYTLNSACRLVFYSDKGCSSAQKTIAANIKGCQNFPATGGSFRFFC